MPNRNWIPSLRNEIDRVFTDFPAMWFDRNAAVLPEMDVHETEKEITVSIELPGVDQKDVDLSVTDQTLTVSGEKKSETETKDGENYRCERHYGSFSRSVTLPFRIDSKAVDAAFDKGVLKIKVKKPAEYTATAQKIEIHG
ncbi:Hsp20/alpha crystallin family protein [Pelagibacterium halotolerans]|uniref:Hsp20/alpha crystallin family protein n=1 Tax=Pelagibacterium halotolerans TaxID=531813 RepID=UPI00384F7701